MSIPPEAPLDLIVGTNYVELQGKTVDKDYNLPGIQFYKSPLAQQEYMIGMLKTTDQLPQPEPAQTVFMALTSTQETDNNSTPLPIDVESYLKMEPLNVGPNFSNTFLLPPTTDIIHVENPGTIYYVKPIAKLCAKFHIQDESLNNLDQHPTNKITINFNITNGIPSIDQEGHVLSNMVLLDCNYEHTTPTETYPLPAQMGSHHFVIPNGQVCRLHQQERMRVSKLIGGQTMSTPELVSRYMKGHTLFAEETPYHPPPPFYNFNLVQLPPPQSLSARLITGYQTLLDQYMAVAKNLRMIRNNLQMIHNFLKTQGTKAPDDPQKDILLSNIQRMNILGISHLQDALHECKYPFLALKDLPGSKSRKPTQVFPTHLMYHTGTEFLDKFKSGYMISPPAPVNQYHNRYATK